VQQSGRAEDYIAARYRHSKNGGWAESNLGAGRDCCTSLSKHAGAAFRSGWPRPATTAWAEHLVPTPRRRHWRDHHVFPD
jgi:hypothetical protein